MPLPSKRYTRRDELIAFDALPPERKIEALGSAIAADSSAIPKEIGTSDFVERQWLKVRFGRSTWQYTTPRRITMYRALWTADKNMTHRMDAKTRLHFTRIPYQARPNEDQRCLTEFTQLLPAEQFAVYDAAWKCKRPLPDFFNPKPSVPRDEQYFEIRFCCCGRGYATRQQLDDLKNQALERMKEAEAIAWKEEKDRQEKLVAGATAEAEKFVDDLKFSALLVGDGLKSRASTAGDDLKSQAALAGSNLKEQAEEGIEAGARKARRAALRKALGF